MVWPFKTRKWSKTFVEEAPDNLRFQKADLRTIKMALDYTWHRMNKHDHCGLRGIISEPRLERLRKTLS